MGLLLRQLFEKESSTYTYIVADEGTGEALIVDSVRETQERDLEIINQLGLKLRFILETHIHANHITTSGWLRQKTGASILIGEDSKLETADQLLKDGEEFLLGQETVQTFLTPGHTEGCTCYKVGPYLFTGDTLLIRGCGRTDFQGGSSEVLFDSVRTKLFSLPDDTLVYPGHDYKGRTCSSIQEEKQWNPRLGLDRSKQEFVQIMENLNLSRPQKMDVAVPANMQSGLSL